MRRLLKTIIAGCVGLGLAVGFAIPAFASESGSILAATNSARSANGLGALSESGSLTAVAQAWAQHMADTQAMGHNPNLLVQIPSGWGAAGENVGEGFADGAATVTAWMNSAGHRANILNSLYNEIGVGWAVDGNGVSWAVQVFAKYQVASAPAPAPAPVTSSSSVSATSSHATVPTVSSSVSHASSAPAASHATTSASTERPAAAVPVTNSTVTNSTTAVAAAPAAAPTTVAPATPTVSAAKLAQLDRVVKATKRSSKKSKATHRSTRSSVRRTAAISPLSSVAVDGVLVLLIGAVGMWIFFAVRRFRVLNVND